MLVIVHHGYVEALFQTFLYIEAFRGLDVLKVDTAKRGCNALHGLAKFLGIAFVYLDVKHIDTPIDLEQQSLALHHGFATHSSNVTQTEHSCSIGNHSHQVTLVGVSIYTVRVLLNLKTGVSHPRRIGQAQVSLRSIGFGWFYFDFTGSALLMIFEGSFFCYLHHGVMLYTFYTLLESMLQFPTINISAKL